MIRHENGRWVLYAADGQTRLGDYDTEDAAKAALAIQEAKRPLVRFEDGAWNLYGTDELLIDSFDTEEEALAVAARNPRRSAGLITPKLRSAAKAEPAASTPAASTERDLSAVFLAPVFEAKDPEGRVWEAEALVEGWSDNRKFYKRAAIERAMPMLEGVQVCAYGWDPDQDKVIGHVPQAVRRMVPGGSLVLNDVGELRNVRGEVKPDGRFAAVCDFHCSHEPLRKKLLERWEAGDRSYLGFSIDGLADQAVGVAEGRRGVIVESITQFFEVTLVKRPAAGGAFRRLVAGNSEEDEPMRRAMLRFITARYQAKKLSTGNLDKLDDKTLQEAVLAGAQEMLSDASVFQILKTFVEAGKTEEVTQILDELIKACGGDTEKPPAPDEQPALVMEAKRIAESMVADVRKAVDEAKAEAAKAVQEAETVKAEAALAAHRANLRETLAGSKLPKAAIDKLGVSLGDRVLTGEQIQEAIEAERTYLAAFAGAGGAGRIHLPGQDVRLGSEPMDRYQLQMDQLFGYQPTEAEKPKYERAIVRNPSIREMYLQITGDEDFTGRVAEGYIQEATTANFPNMLSTSMTRALQQQYAIYEQLWRAFVTVNKRIKDFKTQDRNKLGGFGRVPIVAEGGTYPNLGTPREEISTYAVAKRGGYFEFTIEMVANDDIGALERIAVELANACWNELNMYVFSLIQGNRDGGGINTDTIYDGGVIYSDSHKNKGLLALDFASLDAARTRLRKQLKTGVSALINMAGNLSDSATTIVLDNPGTAGLRAGDVLKIEAEYVLVGAVDSATQISSCTRGHWGSTAAAHLDNVRVYQISGPIPLNGYSLIIPEDLETIADELMNSTLKPHTTSNEYNKFKAEADSGRMKKVVVPTMWLGGDANNWYLARDQKEIQSIELGFWMGKEQPEVQEANDVRAGGLVFTNDVIQMRTRHVYNGVVLDEKGLDGSIVT